MFISILLKICKLNKYISSEENTKWKRNKCTLNNSFKPVYLTANSVNIKRIKLKKNMLILLKYLFVELISIIVNKLMK